MGNDTKERILNAAIDIFAQDGYAGTHVQLLWRFYGCENPKDIGTLNCRWNCDSYVTTNN